MSGHPELTLFLWLEGFFPKQIAYYLLIKGLASSASQLFDGKTNDPRLAIRLTVYDGSGMKQLCPDDPQPEGMSSPCLRIVSHSAADSTPFWVHESSAIPRVLEEYFPGSPTPMYSPTVLGRARGNDIQASIQHAIVDCNYYIKNAASVTTQWSGLADSDRSLVIARYAKGEMRKMLLNVQSWAASSIQEGGWLAPGLQYPGAVDTALAGAARYMELSYSLDIFEDETLSLLQGWYSRFKQLHWWDALEEVGRFPKAMMHPPECREV